MIHVGSMREEKPVNVVEQAKRVLEIEIVNLQKVRDSLARGFADAVAAMLRALEAQRKIVVTGVGKNLPIAEKISATMASTGSTSVVLHPSQALHGDLGMLVGGDILLALSYSGETEELLALVPPVKRMNVSLIAMTGCPDSSLARLSDVVVPVTVEREACPFNMAPTASTTAMLAVGDALAMVLLKARGFEKEDYAKLHPGGSIGRTLLLKVSDIMRTGGRIARVHESDGIKDAVVAMTQARAGSAAVVDDDHHVIAILTDGDLRRHMAMEKNILDLQVRDMMTRHPVTVRSDRLAVDVLNVFEERDIDDVLVVDDEGRLVGAIDIQDLPKLKIM